MDETSMQRLHNGREDRSAGCKVENAAGKRQKAAPLSWLFQFFRDLSYQGNSSRLKAQTACPIMSQLGSNTIINCGFREVDGAKRQKHLRPLFDCKVRTSSLQHVISRKLNDNPRSCWLLVSSPSSLKPNVYSTSARCPISRGHQ